MTDDSEQDSQQRNVDPSVGDLLSAQGVDPVQVELLAEQFFKMFKSTYAAVCARTGQKLLAEAARMHKTWQMMSVAHRTAKTFTIGLILGQWQSPKYEGLPPSTSLTGSD